MTAIKKKGNTAVATNDVPAYLKDASTGRGTENVGADDIILPRISQLQALSSQLDEDNANYIEGAKAGELINTLTLENYGGELMFIPIFWKKEFVVWKDRQKGGGFFGTFPTKSEAMGHINTLEPPVEDYDATETAQQFILVVNPDGSLTEAILSMAKTKLSTSRKLNSLIRLSGRDSFAGVYRLGTVKEKNDSGTFYNTTVTAAGFPLEEHYHAAETCYQGIAENVEKYKAEGQQAGAEDSNF